MPIYLYWGEDNFAISKAVDALRDRLLDPEWASFNYDKIPPEQSDGVILALNQAMTPAFGSGLRLVWLVDTTLCQHCSADMLAELERTLPVIPDTSVLLLTTPNKPDGRLKSTKLLQKSAGDNVREFAPIPPWKTDLLQAKVRSSAAEVGVKLTTRAVELLAEAVGNDTRQLFSEMEKLKIYAFGSNQPLNEQAVEGLIISTTQNSLKLASAIRQGNTATALGLVADLINRNEPALRIVATLIGQFRTWLWVKLMVEAGERDERAIAIASEVGNPKRIHFLRQEIGSISLQQLLACLPLLLELEVSLKRGAEEMSTLQTKIVQMCQILS